MTKKRIFDGFTFFNEIDLLEMRLNHSFDEVDYFVICESNKTFRGAPKTLNFLDHKEKFKPYQDKIIYHVVDDMPGGDNPWIREHFQRNCIRRAVSAAGIEGNDILCITDADEILSNKGYSAMREKDGYFLFKMKMYQFFFNYYVPGQVWDKPYGASWKVINEIPDLSLVRTRQNETFRRFQDCAHAIDEGGWHFTFLGGVERVREKVASYSHTEAFAARLMNADVAAEAIRDGLDVGGMNLTQYVNVDSTFPEIIQKRLGYYESIGFYKAPLERIRELEAAYGNLNRRLHSHMSVVQRDLGKVSAAIDMANGILKRHERQNFAELRFAGPNLLPKSSNFGTWWRPGVQTLPANASDDVLPKEFGHTVMRHTRDDHEAKLDNNVGWMQIPGDRFLKNFSYTASCYIWIPSGTELTHGYLQLGQTDQRRGSVADPSKTDCWQRIWTTGIIRENVVELPMSLHFNVSESSSSAIIYSCCWQIEPGPEATFYMAT